MKLKISVLNSRLARRFFLLFLLCAFLPTILLIGYSYQRVKEQLFDHSWLRMEKECKSYAIGLMDRFSHMDNLLRLYAPFLAGGQPTAQLPDVLREQMAAMFSGLALYRPESGMEVLQGHLDPAGGSTESFDQILKQSDKTTIYTGESEILPKPVYLLVPFRKGEQRGLLVARPEESWFWGTGVHNILPAMTEMAVYNERGTLISATLTSPGPDLPATASRSPRTGNYLQFEYRQDNETYLASGWSLFLASRFNAQTWTIILSASTTDVLGAMLEFKHSFPLMILLAFWIVLLLSLFFIRKTLTPLAILQEGTKRIGAKDFESRVEIDSGDEFEQLADSFNTMTGQLHKQFQTIALIDEIDRSILASLDPSVTIPRSLRMIAELFSCRLIMLAQCAAAEPNQLRLTVLEGSHRNDLAHEHIQLSVEEVPLLFTGEPFIVLRREDFLPAFLRDRTPDDSFLFLPLEADRRVKGALIMNFQEHDGGDAQERIAQARQITDQLAIALSNARLVSDLERLSIGTIEALARTVDAKSKWTAGHSERVADLAVRIGRVMRCGDQLLEQLFHAGLLHDIGKIGIPIAILDKPGKLDDEEYDTIKTHPALGGKILEPIQVYQDIVPIIVQHHERFDGKGYPDGLAGEAINIGARILCVADVFDALISQRPYRQGWIKENVLNFMRENRGVMFDPQVVDAFFSLDI